WHDFRQPSRLHPLGNGPAGLGRDVGGSSLLCRFAEERQSRRQASRKLNRNECLTALAFTDKEPNGLFRYKALHHPGHWLKLEVTVPDHLNERCRFRLPQVVIDDWDCDALC